MKFLEVSQVDTMFREFFHKEIIDFKNLSSDTLVIFDTNTLLNIYRYSNDTRQKLIEVMNEIKENIWIPNQVMLEFSLNRQETLAKLIKEKNEVPNEISQKYLSFYRGIEAFVNDIKIKSIDASSMKEELLVNFRNSLDKLETEFSEQINSILSIVDLTEDLASEFKDLFTNRIGKSYDQEKLDEIAASAIERFKLKIPPAYKDSGKSEVVSYNGVTYEKKYGDLIIWNQILDKAIEKNIKKIVFVTDDNKPDWWFKVQGKTIGPRAELKNELLRISQADLYMFNSNGFLKNFTDTQSNLIEDEIEKNEMIPNSFEGNDINNLMLTPDLSSEMFKHIEKINYLNEQIEIESDHINEMNKKIEMSNDIISRIISLSENENGAMGTTLTKILKNEEESKVKYLEECYKSHEKIEVLIKERSVTNQKIAKIIIT